jgi:hypothetical protein
VLRKEPLRSTIGHPHAYMMSLRVYDDHEFMLHREPHLRSTYNPPILCFHLQQSVATLRLVVGQNQQLRHSRTEFPVHGALHSAYLPWHELSHWSARASTIKVVVVLNLIRVLICQLQDRCMYRDSGSMTMEQWFLFVNVISPAVLYDVELPLKVQQMWCNLRKGLVYFMSYSRGQHRKGLWLKARNHLLQYARMAEENTQGGKRLCTQQLHSAVCHLVEHVELYGPSAFRAEFWVERMVQTLKRVTKCRMGKYPCQTAVIHLTTAAACNVLEREKPKVGALLNTIDAERKLEPGVLRHENFLDFEQQDGTFKDDLDKDGVQLLGNGREASAQEVRDTYDN